MRTAVGARSSAELMQEFTSKHLDLRGEKLNFEGVDGRDVYNITAPFEDEGEWVIAGRVEARDTEYSDVMFFTQKGDVWVPRPNTRCFHNMQDPFRTRIHGELVFGGVEVWPNPVHPDKIDFRTVFYRGKNINDLRLFAVGPQFMKDIRLVELPDGRIGVFTRPHGDIWGRGQIGYTTIDHLDDLTPRVITQARILHGLFTPDEWGGANELHILKNGLIGVLGHIACYSEEMNKHYRAMVFVFDPKTFETSPIKIIATRDNFQQVRAAKNPQLQDVLFSGGLVRLGDGRAVLYTGVNDAEAHRIVIPDPFDEYEQE
nr:DUF1861 family protein [Alicyclobacillus cellulosilyticus]